MNALVYSMVDEADDILSTFHLSAADSKKYSVVKGRFDEYFVQRRNTIFERARFNQRTQESEEPVDTFITALHGLAEHCGYGALRDEMIRDRIVVGLRDARLSEKLQMDPELTLEKAVSAARQSEAVKKQQAVVRGQPQEALSSSIDRVERQTTRCTHNSRAQTTVHGAENYHPTVGTCALHEKLCVTSAGRKAISRQFAAVHTT